MKFTIEKETMSRNNKKAMPPTTVVKHGDGGPSGYGPNGTTKLANGPKSPVDFTGKPKGYDPKPLLAPPKGMTPSST